MDFCEFLAEEEIIEVIPNFKYAKKLTLISGEFGPFQPSIPVKVPLWLALNLRRQHKCTIVMPQWINQLVAAAEQQDERSSLLQLDSNYWREIMKLLEEHCELLPSCSDLIERREAILRTSAHSLFSHAFNSEAILISDVSVHNVSPGELHVINIIVKKAFSHFQKLRMAALEASQSSQASQ
jgi:GINS complex subunit 2